MKKWHFSIKHNLFFIKHLEREMLFFSVTIHIFPRVSHINHRIRPFIFKVLYIPNLRHVLKEVSLFQTMIIVCRF